MPSSFQLGATSQVAASALASAAPVGECAADCCCTIDQFCVSSLTRPGEGLGLTNPGARRQSKQKFEIEWHMKGTGDKAGPFKECDWTYWEVFEPINAAAMKLTPPGFPNGLPTRRFDMFQESGPGMEDSNTLWRRKQDCDANKGAREWEYYTDTPGYTVGQPGSVMAGGKLLSFFVAHGRCDKPVTCCALVRVWYDTQLDLSNRWLGTTEVIGPLCGDVCEKRPAVTDKVAPFPAAGGGHPSRIVDADATFAAYAALTGESPWRLIGALGPWGSGYGARRCAKP